MNSWGVVIQTLIKKFATLIGGLFGRKQMDNSTQDNYRILPVAGHFKVQHKNAAGKWKTKCICYSYEVAVRKLPGTKKEYHGPRFRVPFVDKFNKYAKMTLPKKT